MVINDKGRSSSLDTQVCHSKIMIYLGAATIESNKFNNFNNFVNHNDSKIRFFFVGFVSLSLFFQQGLCQSLILIYKALVRH